MRGLKIANSRIRDAVLKGVPASGPPTLHSNWARSRYVSPEGLNEAFDEAIKITESEMKFCESRIAELQSQLPDPKVQEKIDRLQIKKDYYNPEVHFNHLVQDVDLSLPIYRYLAKRDWSKRDMLLLMQRIEQHHVIPDTLPTLDPRAKVDVKFPTPTARALEPGEVLSSTVTERLPEIRITDFTKEGLYTILIVNPDVPDVEADSFRTELHFAAINVPISYTQNMANVNEGDVIKDYLPPHPDKNLPPQRFCLWVLRQPDAIKDTHDAVSNFNIRAFTSAHNLDPVGVQLWRSKWDRYVPTLREKYNLGSGKVFYRARTAKPDEALLHVRHRKHWPQ